jgi:hypothetical protein
MLESWLRSLKRGRWLLAAGADDPNGRQFEMDLIV